MNKILWHVKSKQQVQRHFGVPESGLEPRQVEENQLKYGPNALPEAKADSLAVIFLRQFQSPLIYILLAASVVIFFINELTDAVIILFILVFNAVVGTIQEGKAQNTLASLKKFVETKATVLRGGIEEILKDTEVVPGDILVLREGDKVPADARVIESEGLTLDEAALTGESQPVYKSPDALRNGNLPPAEQRNMLFKGTNVMAGSGKAIVVAIGAESLIGAISAKISTIESEDPLKRDVSKLSRFIILCVSVICAGLFLFGVLTGQSIKDMFTVVVSLSVSIIPEGLPIVLTLVLATGVWRMSKRNALVKKLQAVESLGQATVIAVDKTGTITKNELVVRKAFIAGQEFDVEGDGYSPVGNVLLAGKKIAHANFPDLLKLGEAAALCANASVAFNESSQTIQVAGDPTEGALVVFAEKLGRQKDVMEQTHRKLSELPFSYQTKYHAVVHGIGGRRSLTVVGAPEKILDLCANIWQGKRATRLTMAEKASLADRIDQVSKSGLRVVGIAYKSVKQDAINSDEVSGLTFLGFVGMEDTLRIEVPEALARARAAGMRVVMITGDHKLTAEAIATQAGIFRRGDQVLTGIEIDNLSKEQLAQYLDKVAVFARVTPEHKLRIIEAYQHAGEIIAMTGDGVNDAPPLVAADLGVAMGKIGTEVAKEAADIILLDDNFGSIVSAVEEGRSIYKTTKKVILYLFSTSFGEVLTITGALVLGLPLPVLAVQLLWLNFVTDGFLDVSLAMEPREAGLLNKRAAAGSSSLLDGLMLRRMLTMALPMAIGALLLFSRYVGGDMVKAWTISVTVLAVFQWFNAWNCRSESQSIFRRNIFSNKYLLGATAIVGSLQLLAVYHPFFQNYLRTTALNFSEWGLIIATAASIILVEEIRKYFYRREESRNFSH
jgi:Ca2+-transporting ATPase